jgi:hypothetical protein
MKDKKRISNTNKLSPYILPPIHRLQILSIEEEQWRRQREEGEREKSI